METSYFIVGFSAVPQLFFVVNEGGRASSRRSAFYWFSPYSAAFIQLARRLLFDNVGIKLDYVVKFGEEDAIYKYKYNDDDLIFHMVDGISVRFRGFVASRN